MQPRNATDTVARMMAPRATVLLVIICSALVAPLFGQSAAAQPAVPVEGENEAWILQHPEDANANAEHALFLGKQARAEPDAVKARELNKRSRRFAEVALKAGSSNPLLALQIAEVNEDGSTAPRTFSDHGEANKLISEGEKLYGQGDMKGAAEAYRKALALDPSSYPAALYLADVDFALKNYEAAIAGFDVAIATDPRQPTAYRYRGDCLLRLRRFDEARDAYVQALVRDPYNPLTRKMLPQWASVAKRPLQIPDASFPRGQIKIQDGKPTMELPPGFNALELVYLAARLKWWDEEGKMKTVPPQTEYRHSLAEEAAGLRAVITVSKEFAAHPKPPETPAGLKDAIALLEKLDAAGLLEAHILLSRPTQGIAADYRDYAAANHDKLVRYVRTTWFAPDDKAPPGKP